MKTKISYLIPVHNEHKELDLLLNHLYPYLLHEDEIIIQGDQGKVTPEVISVIRTAMMKHGVKYVEFPLRRDFATFKNNLLKQGSGTHLFLIDADELPHPRLLENIHWLTEENPKTDIFVLPRVNIVKGLTWEWSKKWGWNVVKVPVPDDDYTSKILDIYGAKTEDISLVNPMDYQQRIFKKSANIRYQNKVHERIDDTGKSWSVLPHQNDDGEMTFVWSLFHVKTLERQVRQNEFYSSI